jgi:hypothetical protein
LDNFPSGSSCNTDLFLTKKEKNLRHAQNPKSLECKVPIRVLRPISELIVCEGSSLTFHWLENPRPTTGRKALSLRERSTFWSGLVMSWVDEVDQVDFGIFRDIEVVEDYEDL